MFSCKGISRPQNAKDRHYYEWSRKDQEWKQITNQHEQLIVKKICEVASRIDADPSVTKGRSRVSAGGALKDIEALRRWGLYLGGVTRISQPVRAHLMNLLLARMFLCFAPRSDDYEVDQDVGEPDSDFCEADSDVCEQLQMQRYVGFARDENDELEPLLKSE